MKLNKKCEKGEHTFIVQSWQNAGVKKFATAYVCQHCLLLIDAQQAQIIYKQRKKDFENG